jgi:KipI family sensor histidine kinase inhibitor
MEIVAAGDSSLLVRFGGGTSERGGRHVFQLLASLQETPIPEVLNLQPAYDSVLLSFDPRTTDSNELEEKVRKRLKSKARLRRTGPNTVKIPVCYDEDFGPDLGAVAARAIQTPAEVVKLHCGAAYRACFLGFLPGFAYLSGLSPQLETPRLDSPRRLVPPGSVGIAGRQTGVYPFASPGGWRLIGRTPLKMFDPGRAQMSLLAPGDDARFVPITRAEYENLLELPAPAVEREARAAAITVVAPGMFTTVQDLGRPGHGLLGISPGGAADRTALIAGNRLADNADGAAALEMTLLGGAFRFEIDALIAVTGSDFAAEIDGAPVASWTAVPVRAGQVLRLGHTRQGARAYLCVRGGIEVPLFLGSASTHVLSGLGGFEGRALRQGDVLSVGAASKAVAPGLPARSAPRKTLRVLPGPDWGLFSPAARKTFFAGSYEVTPHCDRLGLRLSGPAVARKSGTEYVSTGVCVGSVQIAPDGQPMILFVDQQTTGGYPQLACVVSVDHSSLGQLKPGDEVRFEL